MTQQGHCVLTNSSLGPVLLGRFISRYENEIQHENTKIRKYENEMTATAGNPQMQDIAE